MKTLPDTEKPLERMLMYGAEHLSEVELFSIILWSGGGRKGLSILELCRTMLKRTGGVHGLDDISIIELCAIKGFGVVKSAKIKAVVEIAKRYQTVPLKPGVQLKNSGDVARCFMPHMRSLKREIFKVINLDAKNKIINTMTISEGDLTSTIVNPREVYREAIRSSAAGIIVLHNHPSGDPSPSGEDMYITNRLREAGRIVNIELLDHLIIGRDSYCSFADEGKLLRENNAEV
jgi:DNA repair protein RadC